MLLASGWMVSKSYLSGDGVLVRSDPKAEIQARRMAWFKEQLAKAGNLGLRAQHRLYTLAMQLGIDQEMQLSIPRGPRKGVESPL